MLLKCTSRATILNAGVLHACTAAAVVVKCRCWRKELAEYFTGRRIIINEWIVGFVAAIALKLQRSSGEKREPAIHSEYIVDGMREMKWKSGLAALNRNRRVYRLLRRRRDVPRCMQSADSMRQQQPRHATRTHPDSAVQFSTDTRRDDMEMDCVLNGRWWVYNILDHCK